MLEWKLLMRGIGTPRTGAAVTFIVNASKGEDMAITVRLSGAGAIAKARSLLDEGWQVVVTGPDGVRYHPPEFDKLLALNSPGRPST
jgi:hypothetical protein